MLRHRIVLAPEAALERYSPDDAVAAALSQRGGAAVSPTALTAALLAAIALAAFALPLLPVLLAVVVLLAAFAVDASRIRRAPAARRELPELLSLGVAEPYSDSRRGTGRLRRPAAPAQAR